MQDDEGFRWLVGGVNEFLKKRRCRTPFWAVLLLLLLCRTVLVARLLTTLRLRGENLTKIDDYGVGHWWLAVIKLVSELPQCRDPCGVGAA